MVLSPFLKSHLPYLTFKNTALKLFNTDFKYSLPFQHKVSTGEQR